MQQDEYSLRISYIFLTLSLCCKLSLHKFCQSAFIAMACVRVNRLWGGWNKGNTLHNSDISKYLQNPVFPQRVCPQWGVLTVSVKAGAWSGCSLWSRVFLVNFRKRCLLWNVDMHFDCARSHKLWAAVLGRGILPANFRMTWPLWNLEMHFDCEGSREVCAAVLGPGIFPVNFCINFEVQFDCAGSHNVCVAVLGRVFL